MLFIPNLFKKSSIYPTTYEITLYNGGYGAINAVAVPVMKVDVNGERVKVYLDYDSMNRYDKEAFDENVESARKGIMDMDFMLLIQEIIRLYLSANK